MAEIARQNVVRVAWLCPYPVHELSGHGLELTRNMPGHPCSWIMTLLAELAGREDVEVRIVTASHLVRRDQMVMRDGVWIRVLRHTFPFTCRGFPDYLPLDVLTGYPRLVRGMRRALREWRPDLVHAHGTEFVYGLAAAAAGFPWCVSIQGILREYAPVTGNLRQRLSVRHEIAVVRRAKHVLCRTGFDTAFARGVNPSARIHDAPEAMAPVFHAAPWRDPGGHRILFVGSCLPRKGLADLVEAVALVRTSIPETTLDVVGGGDRGQREAIEFRIAALGLAGSVRFLGTRAAAEIAVLHRECAVFALPSHIENSPNALAEALVSGMPVVAADVGGVRTMVKDGETGLVVPPRDPKAMASALARLLTEPGLRARLAAGARASGERHHPASVARRTMEIYRRILPKSADAAETA